MAFDYKKEYKDIPLALVVLVERWGFYPDSCGYLLHGDGFVAADGEQPQRLDKYQRFGVSASHCMFLRAALMHHYTANMR
jgi:hypothetical protein